MSEEDIEAKQRMLYETFMDQEGDEKDLETIVSYYLIK